MPVVTEDKLLRLKEMLSALESVAVAFSGGVDSTFLLAMCREVLGERVLALTAASPVHPAREVDGAAKAAGSLGVRHLVVRTEQMRDPRFTSNPADRCYHCKKAVYQDLARAAAADRIHTVVDGSQLDDRGDYRPGARAAAELGVRRPLEEASLTKAEIRAASREMGLAGWDRPPSSCLATRIPYGSPITEPALSAIDDAETFIRGLGVGQVRVRHHGRLASIEVDPRDIGSLADGNTRKRIVRHLKELGFRHVALDLAGYRPGSLNEGVLQ